MPKFALVTTRPIKLADGSAAFASADAGLVPSWALVS